MNKQVIAFLLFLFISLLSPLSTNAQEKASRSSASLARNSEELGFDRRVHVLADFLKQHKSPLEASARTFVETADSHNIDWKLVAAISGVESTFAHHLPYNSYNAWGWGIYGDNMIYFTSYDEGIQIISQSLRQRYMDTWGAQTVHDIGRYYAASPTWADRVVYFMANIDQFALDNPSSTLSISL